MSWSPDLYIGELRPWPDSVRVVRGNTDEARRYTPERKDGQEVIERRIDELCAEVEHGKAENAKLRELVQYILDEGYGDDWFGKKAEELGFKANY